MKTRAQPDLFLKPKPSKRKLREVKRKWRSEVEQWAKCVLLGDVFHQFTDPDNESSYIMIDGSGPPSSWRKTVIEGLTGDLYDRGQDSVWLDDATDAALVKCAIRLGRLPRSVVEAMPPKPVELLS